MSYSYKKKWCARQIFIFLCALCLLLPVVFGCDSTLSATEKVKKDHKEARDNLKAGKYDEAIKIWLIYAQLDTKSVKILNSLGEAYLKKGDYDNSMKYYKESVELEPKSGKAYFGMARIYERKKEYGNTLKFYRRSLELGYKPVILQRRLTAIQKEHEEAIKALWPDGKSGRDYYKLAHVLKVEGKYEEAIKAFQTSAERHYKLSQSYFNLGQLYRDIGSFKDARDVYKKMKSSGSSHFYRIEAKIALIELYMEEDPDNPDKIFKLAEKYMDVYSDEVLQRPFDEGDYNSEYKDYFSYSDRKYRPDVLIQKVLELDPGYLGSHEEAAGFFLDASRLPNNRCKAWQEYLKELRVHPGKEKTLKALKALRDEMRIPLTEGRSPHGDFKETNSVFRTESFPKTGIVIKGDVPVYGESLLKSGELQKGERIELTGLYPYALGCWSGLPYAAGSFKYFYIIKGDKDDKVQIVSVEDIVVDEQDDPAYISPDGSSVALKTPIYFYHDGDSFFKSKKYHVWLKPENGDIVFIGPYYKNWDNSVDNMFWSPYWFKNAVSWSPDGEYLFVECSGKVYSKGGRLLFDNEMDYTSPLWHGGHVYFRGTAGDDAVYSLNLESMEFKKFFDSIEGGWPASEESYDIREECKMLSKPMRFEDGTFKINFLRHAPEPRNYSIGACLDVEVTVDESGEVISKKSRQYQCY